MGAKGEKLMKYARLIYGNNKWRMASQQFKNVGDCIQTFAVDGIYKQLGIKKEDICALDRNRLREYHGEQVILPMQGHFENIKGAEVFPLSDEIKPIFMGYSSTTEAHYTQECIKAYQENGPVCCRDEGTWKLMKKKGINAYLTGCLTIMLPERDKEPENGKVFLVDAPPAVEQYMPEDLKRNTVYVTHEIQWYPKNSDEEELERIEALSGEILERYRNEAALVITSRLHCAAPCMAMGIPVILVRNYFDTRYMWIDKYLPLYTPDRFSQIDWHPARVDLSVIKPMLIKMASALIFDEEDKEQIMKQVHDFYMDRKRETTKTPLYVSVYYKVCGICPRFADFMREVVLKKYTVATARDKKQS